jgi:hypothetical protein
MYAMGKRYDAYMPRIAMDNTALNAVVFPK